MTGNLSALDNVLETWSNHELIAVNQDPMGYLPVRGDLYRHRIIRR